MNITNYWTNVGYKPVFTPSNNNSRPNSITQRNYPKVSANHLIAAKGINFKSRSLNNLYEEYNWYINNDHTPAVDAFLKMDAEKENMDGFLTSILNTDRSYQFVDSMIRQPRRLNGFANALASKVGENSQNIMIFSPDCSYKKAYDRYLDDRYHNAHTLSELLRIRPDWKGDVLLEKHRQLKGNDSLEIGNIPKEFPGNHLFEIADYLSGFMDYGMKNKKDINNLRLGNREYEFKFFTEGRSDKNVFGVFTPEKKKYVFKMAPESSRSLDNPFALGTLAKIDSYLTTNRSRNSAPICYYNHDRNLSVYKYIEHTHVDGRSKDLSEITKQLPDFYNLGLAYNDNVGDKNFFVLNMNSNSDITNTEGFEEGVKHKEWISVDNDHVTFNQRFQPAVPKYNAPLPNAMQMFF